MLATLLKNGFAPGEPDPLPEERWLAL